MTPDDVLSIMQLQVDYARAADSFSGTTYAEVFTDDGILDATETGIPAVSGRASISALMDETFAQQTHNMHMTMNQRVTAIEGDTATGWCYFLQRSILKNGGHTEFYGRYDDLYHRTPEGWKIKHRKLIELLPTVLNGYLIPDGDGAVRAPR